MAHQGFGRCLEPVQPIEEKLNCIKKKEKLNKKNREKRLIKIPLLQELNLRQQEDFQSKLYD